MARVIWTPPALRDVSRLHRFLAPKNRTAAQRAVGTIRTGASTISAHLEIGRPIDEMPPEFREWLIPFGDSGYVMLYRIDGDLVVILAVRHAREAGY